MPYHCFIALYLPIRFKILLKTIIYASLDGQLPIVNGWYIASYILFAYFYYSHIKIKFLSQYICTSFMKNFS